MAQLNETLKEAIEKARALADTQTVIGEPINLVDGVTILPVSRISVGTAIGGGEYAAKKNTRKTGDEKVVSDSFSGGSGVGVAVTPVAFLVVSASGETKLLNIGENTGYLSNAVTDTVNGINTALDKAPEVFDKIKGLFASKKKKDKDTE